MHQAFAREAVIDECRGGAELGDGKDRQQELCTVLHEKSHAVAAPDASLRQQMRQLIDLGIEFGIGPLPTLEKQHYVTRVARDRVLEHRSKGAYVVVTGNFLPQYGQYLAHLAHDAQGFSRAIQQAHG
jgi:hypothetical protein